MTAAAPAANELETPYWRLQDENLPSGFAGTLDRLKLSVTPVIEIIVAAAPGAAATVAAAQIAIALTVTATLVLVNEVLGVFFSDGGNFARVEQALPMLLALGGVFAVKTGAEFVSALARACLSPTARREAEGRLFDATLRVDPVELRRS